MPHGNSRRAWVNSNMHRAAPKTHRANTPQHRTRIEHSPYSTELVARKHRASPNSQPAITAQHRTHTAQHAAPYSSQRARRCAPLSAECSSLRGAYSLHVRHRAHRTKPCANYKRFYTLQNAVHVFLSSTHLVHAASRCVYAACTASTVHAPRTKRRKCKRLLKQELVNIRKNLE